MSAFEKWWDDFILELEDGNRHLIPEIMERKSCYELGFIAGEISGKQTALKVLTKDGD